MATKTATISAKVKQKCFSEGYQSCEKSINEQGELGTPYCPYVLDDEPQKHAAWWAGWESRKGEMPPAAPKPSGAPDLDTEKRIDLAVRSGLASIIQRWALISDDEKLVADRFFERVESEGLTYKTMTEQDYPVELRRFIEGWSAEPSDSTADEKFIEIQIPCDFGGVSIGDATARLGIKIDRNDMSVQKADWLFCGKQLEVTIILGRGDPSQMTLPGMEETAGQLKGVVSCKRFGVGPKAFSVGLTFEIGAVEVTALARYAKRAGAIRIHNAEELPDGEDDDDEHHVQFPVDRIDHDPLYAKSSDVAKVMAKACLILPLAVIESWNDEERDSVLAWAKAAALGVQCTENPQTPEVLREFVCWEQERDPSGYVEQMKTLSPHSEPIVHLCENCGHEWAVTRDSTEHDQCQKCNAGIGRFVGYWGQLNVWRDGRFANRVTVDVGGIPTEFRMTLYLAQNDQDEYVAGYSVAQDDGTVLAISEPKVTDDRGTLASVLSSAIGELIDELKPSGLDKAFMTRLQDIETALDGLDEDADAEDVERVLQGE